MYERPKYDFPIGFYHFDLFSSCRNGAKKGSSELEAENSLIVAQFQAKKSETELLRLSGQLIDSKQTK